jgi:hypothetical protein
MPPLFIFMALPVLAPFGIIALFAAPPAFAADMRLGPEALPYILPPLLQDEPFISLPFGFTADAHGTGWCLHCGVHCIAAALGCVGGQRFAQSFAFLIAPRFSALMARTFASFVLTFAFAVCHISTLSVRS